MKSKIRFYAHTLLESLNEESSWLQLAKKSTIFGSKLTKIVFSASREHGEFFVLFQRETLNASLGNQPVTVIASIVINYFRQKSLFVIFVSFLLFPPEVFCKINFAYFTGNTCVGVSF